MALTLPVFCAGLRRRSSSLSCFPFRGSCERGFQKENHFMNEPLNDNSEATQKLRIAVVGGGPGGYAAAFLAADLGMQVTLIDPEPNPGAVSLYRAGIPSKTLLPLTHPFP